MLQKLAQILYEAAADCSYVDPKKVEQILKTSQEDIRLPKSPKGFFADLFFKLKFNVCCRNWPRSYTKQQQTVVMWIQRRWRRYSKYHEKMQNFLSRQKVFC